MNSENKESVDQAVGLSTALALQKLHDDITGVLETYDSKESSSKQNEILPIYSIFITLLVNVGLIYTSYYLTSFCLLLILILNVVFVQREEGLRRTELRRKAELILEDIKLGITLSKDWRSINYPHLCSPLSPCISLVWTYRDNELGKLIHPITN